MNTDEDTAAQFVSARLAGRGIAAYPGRLPASLAQAYAIQDAGIARTADTVGGWKVGRIFPPMSLEFGADRLAGPIFTRAIQHANSSQMESGICVGRTFADGFGAAEAEFLLHVAMPPPVGQMRFSLDEAADIIDRVHVGIEIASSPLPSINDLGPAVTASDFGNNNGLIVGSEIPDWRASDFCNWPVKLLVDNACVGEGSAAAFPDGAIGSVRFLLELLARRGIGLPAGSWISSGAITGVHPVGAGQTVEALFAGQYSTRCVIESAGG